jgi:ribosomal protein S18 acetylase RimI-like enzyme
MMSFIIRQGDLDGAIEVLLAIPEFDQPPSKESIQHRISGVPHLVLTAHDGSLALGCKIGYLRDGVFYSWLGAVRPAYRQTGVAEALADEQEKWAMSQGYDRIWMKTRNRFPAMLLIALRRGFMITRIDVMPELKENRIYLEKHLKKI